MTKIHVLKTVERIFGEINNNTIPDTFIEFIELKHKIYLTKKLNNWDINVQKLKEFYKSEKYKTISRYFRNNETILNKLFRLRNELQNDLNKGIVPENDIHDIATTILLCTEIRKIISGRKKVKVPGLIRLRRRTYFQTLAIQKILFNKGKLFNWKLWYRRELLMLENLFRLLDSLNISTDPNIKKTTNSILAYSFARTLVVALALGFVVAIPWEAHVSSQQQDKMTFEQRFHQNMSSLKDSLNDSKYEIEFQKKYNVDIYGSFNQRIVTALDSYFSMYHQDLIKLARIKRLYISPNQKGEAIGMVRPKDPLYGTHMVLFSKFISKETFDHEFAHMLHFAIRNNRVDSSWLAIHGKYPKGSDVNQYGNGTPGNLPRYGYVMSYGATNMFEDIATYVELIKNYPVIFAQVKESFPIYRDKINWLAQRDFITKTEQSVAIKYLHQAASNVHK